MENEFVDAGDYADALIDSASRGDNPQRDIAKQALNLLNENVDAEEREYNLEVVKILLEYLGRD